VAAALNEQTAAILLALALLQLVVDTVALKLYLQTQRPLEVLVEVAPLFRTHQGLLVLQARAMQVVTVLEPRHLRAVVVVAQVKRVTPMVRVQAATAHLQALLVRQFSEGVAVHLVCILLLVVPTPLAMAVAVRVVRMVQQAPQERQTRVAAEAAEARTPMVLFEETVVRGALGL
jgi:uncharacterized membrane protein